MLKSDPFLLSAAEVATTEAMRATGAIPHDWRCVDIPWQSAAVFDKIVEIGDADLHVLSYDQCDEKKCGQIVFGPDASKRIGERADEILVLFETTAYRFEAHAVATQDAA
jgi:hypothetical protein